MTTTTNKKYPTIWLIRHSIREDRKTTNGVSETDCSISEEGVKLAEGVANNLKKLLDSGSPVDKIYMSPYKRTLETGYIIASKFPHIRMEISPLISEVIINHSQPMDIRVPHILNSLLQSNGVALLESKDGIFKRCREFIDKVNADGSSNVKKEDDNNNNNNILVVTHGGIINVILMMLFDWYKFNLDVGRPHDQYVPKCCDYVAVQYDEEGKKWKLVESNWLSLPVS